MLMRASDCVPLANGQHRSIRPAAPFQIQRQRHTHKRIHVNTFFCICNHDRRNEHGSKGHWHVREEARNTEHRNDQASAMGSNKVESKPFIHRRAGP